MSMIVQPVLGFMKGTIQLIGTGPGHTIGHVSWRWPKIMYVLSVMQYQRLD
ncbi:hypothetical protein [Novosphingobium sp. KACC 22771]|uniref:hypothetical protein n=1 Tax=Novosphingobium sp. KACC 22771 TaxID=3025670 RepID=UPI0023668809|nr:hypothetical protein [Novosphingobium sp. KACC 22771]WDF74222.1 hypothetical protein PQ467_19905 [Novosphingobium sp. KACC 22771]